MIRVSKSSIDQNEIDAVTQVLKKEYLGMGEEVLLFEEKIKSYLKTTSNVVAVNSGTSALMLALSALNLQPGDEVLVPTITYVATYQAISFLGAVPVSCDVLPDTLFIDVADARAKITKRTKVILPVHYASSAAGISNVYQFANEFNLRVVEDAAQSFGGLCNGKQIGSYGDIICFSFDGIKNITCGEGGAIITADNTLLDIIKDGRLLGVENDSDKRYKNSRSFEFDVKRQGYRFHLSNINAAIGISQLDKINYIYYLCVYSDKIN